MFHKIITLIFLFNLIILPASAAPGSLALSVTPPLIKSNISPGQLWKSTVKVVNNNTEEITVYVQAIDFKGNGEDGTVTFIEAEGNEDEADYLLSRWINLPEDSIDIVPGKSYEVPFIVAVPETAAPGGHYAAILVGTRPPEGKISGASIKVSSLISTLLMLNVSGDVNENGQIREFSTDKTIYGQGKVDFKIRFENLGNVHVQPQGEIRVFDMWDKNVFGIKINHLSEFGNVLPGDIRTWNFDWQEDIGLMDMGRYRAELILAYGDKARETLTGTRYFWIILWKPLGLIIVSVFLLLSIIYILVRRSIKRAIRDTEQMAGVVRPDKRVKSGVTIVPKENGSSDSVIVDLKNNKSSDKVKNKKFGWKSFKRILCFIIFIILIIGAVMVYKMLSLDQTELKENISETKNYEAEVIEPELEIETSTTSPEFDTKNDLATSSMEELEESEEAIVVLPDLIVLNGGGVSGAAGRAEKLLDKAGFNVLETGNADNFNYQNTVIKYSEKNKLSAEKIKELFTGEIELELVDETDGVTIIVGKEF